jgi:hypothetical protein
LINQGCRRPKSLGASKESDRRIFLAFRPGCGLDRGIIQPRARGQRSVYIADRIRKGCNSVRSKSLAADAASTDQIHINIWEIVLRECELPIDFLVRAFFSSLEVTVHIGEVKRSVKKILNARIL